MRVAVAGAAHPHVSYVIDEIARTAGLELVAVADRDRAVARSWAGSTDARLYTDVSEMIDASNPQIVCVAGVYSERADAVLAALGAGCHVIADKPLCTTLDDLSRIDEVARANSAGLSLLLEKRYYPETRAMRDLLADGAIGTVVGVDSVGPHRLNRASRPDWFFDPRTYGGILNDLAVHDLDLALRVLGGSGPITVTGLTAASDREGRFDRYGVATVRTSSGIATIHVDWLTPAASAVHGDYQMRIVGTHGTIEVYWARHSVIMTSDRLDRHEVALPEGGRPAQSIFAALLRGETPDISTTDSIRVTRLALLAQRSARHDAAPEVLQASQ